MQSNQSKLVMAGLVAAHTVTALEIKETGLAQTTPAASINMLAQIQDGDISDSERAPGNNNNDDVHNNDPGTRPNIPEDDEINEKIDMLTTSQLAGLQAKEKFICDKIERFRDEQVRIFCDMDEQCREKSLAQKAASKAVIDQAFADGVAAAKKCRTDFVESTLTKKEIIKGQLEDLLNDAIQQIKELKVEGIFADSGIPTDEHKTAIDAAIAEIIGTFESDSDLLLTNESDAFVETLGIDLLAFEDSGPATETDTCLDDVRAAFRIVYEGDDEDEPSGTIGQ